MDRSIDVGRPADVVVATLLVCWLGAANFAAAATECVCPPDRVPCGHVRCTDPVNRLVHVPSAQRQRRAAGIAVAASEAAVAAAEIAAMFGR